MENGPGTRRIGIPGPFPISDFLIFIWRVVFLEDVPAVPAPGTLQLWNDRAGEVEQADAEVRAESQQVDRAFLGAEQKGEGSEIAFLLVAGLARQHEVVAAIESRLSPPRRNMVERHRARLVLGAAVCADGSVLFQQPLARGDERVARRRNRRVLVLFPVGRCRTPSASPAAAS